MAYTNVSKPGALSYTNLNPTGKQQYDQSNLTYDSSATAYDGVDFFAYTNVATPSLAWNVSKSSIVGSYDMSAQVSRIETVWFSPDGTRMYILNGSGPVGIYQYSLSAWDLSTLSYVQSFNPSGSYFDALFMRDDGLKFYIADSGGDIIRQYALTTAWDISTASVEKTFSTSSISTNCGGVFFSPDGLKMFSTDYNAQTIFQFYLDTAWDISTAHLQASESVSSYSTNPEGLFIRYDGRKLYFNHYLVNPLRVLEFDLINQWDITTMVYNQSFTITSYGTNPFAVYFKPNGLSMFTTSTINVVPTNINQFNLSGSYTNIAKPV